MCWKRHIWRKRRLFLPFLYRATVFCQTLPCNSVLVQRRLDANLTNSYTDKGSAHLLHQRSKWYEKITYLYIIIIIVIIILMITQHHHHCRYHTHDHTPSSSSSSSYSWSHTIIIIIIAVIYQLSWSIIMMNGWMHGWMEWMDGMDGWMDGWMGLHTTTTTTTSYNTTATSSS